MMCGPFLFVVSVLKCAGRGMYRFGHCRCEAMLKLSSFSSSYVQPHNIWGMCHCMSYIQCRW